jgi:hypothetical protein
MRKFVLVATAALASTMALAPAHAAPGYGRRDLACYIFGKHENYYLFRPNMRGSVVEQAYGVDGVVRRVEPNGRRPIWTLDVQGDGFITLQSEEDRRFSIVVDPDGSANLWMFGRATASGHCEERGTDAAILDVAD